MNYQFPPDIGALVQSQMATGYFATEDDVLRAALAQLAAEEDDVRAIQESIDMMDAGDEGRPAEEVFAELRAKYKIPETT